MECALITFNGKALTRKLARRGNQPGSQKRTRTTCLSLTGSKRKREIWKKSAEYREEAAEDSLSNGKTLKNRGAFVIPVSLTAAQNLPSAPLHLQHLPTIKEARKPRPVPQHQQTAFHLAFRSHDVAKVSKETNTRAFPRSPRLGLVRLKHLPKTPTLIARSCSLHGHNPSFPA